MSALTNRQMARERLSQVFQSILDKMIPADEAVPLEGSKFVDWEDQGDELARTMVPLFLEERAALEDSADSQAGGRCPHCGSTHVYLIKRDTQKQQIEVITPYGPVVLKKQRGRCRACDRSFSPSGKRLGLAGGGQSLPQGGGAGGS
jgi:hypothetical protein